jgi:hypothetical protein
MRKRFFLKPALSFFIIMSLWQASCAWAGIRIDKPKVRLSIAPGSYDSGEMEVINTGKEEAVVRAYLEDWVYSNQDGAKAFSPKGTASLSCSNWISFYPADFTLKPNGVQKVRYTVNVPKDTIGGHYAVMFFETGGGSIEQPSSDQTTVMVQIMNRLGALFYVEPDGTIKKTAEIKSVDMSEKSGNFSVAVNFLNSGNTDVTVKGTFNVIDREGYVYARGEFDSAYTMPGGKAVLQSTVPSLSLKSGDYDMIVTLEYENGGTLVHQVSFQASSGGAITLQSADKTSG